MPILAATTIGSLSPNAQAIWRAQAGVARRNILVIREEDFPTAAIFNGVNFNNYFGQAWRNTAANSSANLYDSADQASSFLSLWSYVKDRLNQDPSISYIAYDFPSIIGLILEDNFYDDRPSGSELNLIANLNNNFIGAFKTWLAGQLIVPRTIKIGIVGLPCISRWKTSDNGATYQRISSRDVTSVSQEVTQKFFNLSDPKWGATSLLLNDVDFMLIDGRDFLSWEDGEADSDRSDYINQMSYIARSLPAPAGPIGTEKEILCTVSDHEFLPPFRRAKFPALTKDWRVRPAVAAKDQFKNPPPASMRSFVYFDFAKQPSVSRFVTWNGNASTQTRSGSLGINDPSSFSSWREFINNRIKPWYQWGHRRFWLQFPFGRPNQSGIPGSFNAPESAIHQMDSWIAAKYGQNIGGTKVNDPMPWITDDFVGAWHYLCTGQPLANSTEIFNLNRHQSFDLSSDPLFSWFNPADPIEAVGFIGSPMSHIGSSHPNAMDRLNAMDPDRFQIFINDCYEPILWSGMSIGLDKGALGPQSWPGKAVSTHALNGHLCNCTNTNNISKCYLSDNLQSVWYRWVSDLARRHPKRIYMGGLPKKLSVIDPLEEVAESNLGLLGNDYKLFSFVCDDNEYISLTENAPLNNVHERNEYVSSKQEVVRYAFNDFIPVEITSLEDNVTSPSYFFSLFSDSFGEAVAIEPPRGITVIGKNSFLHYKTNNDGSGSLADPWKIFYARHVIMKKRAIAGQAIEPLYSSFIEHDKLNVLNNILTGISLPNSLAGYSTWLSSNSAMGATPPSTTANTLLFYPRIMRIMSSGGGVISDHEQVVDSILPAISGCVDGFVLDSFSNARVFNAFSNDIFNDSDEFGMLFNSRRIIKYDFFENRIGSWKMAWTGSDSIDDRGQVSEMVDENALSTIISISNPSYESCVCDRAGVLPENVSSSSSSSSAIPASSSSSEIPVVPPVQFRSSFYTDIHLRGAQSDNADDTYYAWNFFSPVALFVGQPEANAFSPINKRAFAWECDPSNPSQSSPWHNCIYEMIIDAYQWGSRAFEFFQPFGDYDNNPARLKVNPRTVSDPDDYLVGSSFLTLKFWETKFSAIPTGLTSPNTIVIPPVGDSAASRARLDLLARCPCRWKGFKQAIKAVIEGNLSPDASTGRPPINEPCKVSFYLPGLRGYGGYRYRSNMWWDKYFAESKAANPSAAFHVHASYADTKFYQDLDYVVQQFVEMKGTIPGTEDSLSITIDIGSNCPTPDTAFLFAPSWMIAGGSIPTNQANQNAAGPEDGQPDYRTEALELADWYVINKFKQFGIKASIETRPEKYRIKARMYPGTDAPSFDFPALVNPRTNNLVLNGSVDGASTRPVNPSGVPITSDLGWYDGWSNQDICAVDSTFSVYESGNEIFGFFTPLDEISSYHKLSFSNIYPPFDIPTANPAVRQTSDFYGDKKTLTFNGVTVRIRDLSPSDGYGPYSFLWNLYPIVDTYRYVYNQLNSGAADIKGIVHDLPQTVVYDALHLRTGLFPLPIFDGVKNYNFQYWRLNESFFNPNEPWMEAQRIFNETNFLNNPSGYTGGLWTQEGRAFWNTNIRTSSFDKFISMLHSFATNGAPIGSENQGWTGDIYPNDFYSKNVISAKLFGSEELPPIASTPVIGREALPWFQSSDFSLQYQFSAFDAVLFCQQYVYKIPGAQQGGTPPQAYSPLFFCALKDMVPGCASTTDDGAFYKNYQLTGSLPPGWTFGSANGTTLTQLRQDFANRISIDRMIRAMSLNGPDNIVVFMKGGSEPLWWDTQIPGLRQFPLFADDGTGSDAVGLAIDILQEYKNASNKYRCKLIGYFFPFAWIELDPTVYPFAIDIINRNIKEGRHGPNIDYRSIFKNGGLNIDFLNHLINVHVEFAQLGMDQDTGYGFRGAYWDSSPIFYAMDFSPAAKAASGIDTSVDFPFPLTEGTPLYNYLIFGPDFNGNVASIILKPIDNSVGWTAAVRDKLESYVYALRRKEAEFVRLLRQGVDDAGFADFLILPALISSVYSFELPMNSEYMLPFTSGQKSEIGIEQYKRRKQPSGISTPFGTDATPDWWLGLYHDLLSLNGRAGKRTSLWQIGQWIQPTSMRFGKNCDETYATCLENNDALYGNPSQLGFYYGDTLGILPRDVAVRGWLENQSLLCLASHSSIEFMYGFYDWSQYDSPELLDDFSNSANDFALQHLPFMRKISSVLRSISDCKLKLTNRSSATWCLIMVRNEYLWKQGIYPPGNAPAEYAKIWPILGALQTCVEHGVPHTIVHDGTFMAANYDNAPILIVTMPASELPLEVQDQIDLFTGKVIFMEAEYVASPPRLEKNFHNTTIDVPTGKTRAQISREKLWDLMISGGTPISVQTAIEIPAFLPEKPSPLTSYEIGEDVFGNAALNIIMLADASWHDLRKHAFYIDWNNGPDFAVDGICGRQNLLYVQPITPGGSTPVRVENGGFRSILDRCACPDGFNRDCYLVEYTSSGTIPIQFLPARGKLTFYAGYPPVWGNKRNASVTVNARQQPYRVRQLLLNHDKGYFDPVDMYVDSNQFDLISFEQGSYAQIQFKQPNLMLPHMSICVTKSSTSISNVDEYIAFLENLSSVLPSTTNIFVLMRCNGITKNKLFKANLLLSQMASDASVNAGDYAWMQENPSSLFTPSDYWPIGFIEADVSQCGPGEVSISGIIFQKEGICTIAKRIPLLELDANDFNTPTCTCALDTTLVRVDRVPSVQDALGNEIWEPLIEAPLFNKTQFADGSFLFIKPVSDNTSPFFNVDANGLPKATGILAYLRSINNNIKTFTQNQKTIADLYSGIVLDFQDAFDISQNAIHPTYCSLPNDVSTSQVDGYMEGRRDIADVNGTFIKVMSKIRLEFPGTKVAIRWMGSFGDGSAIQAGRDDPTASSILSPTFDARKGLQRRISESYGPILEASDFIPIEGNDGTALGISSNKTSIAYSRNHFVERNSASSSMYRSGERKPIFVATWMPTDHTVWTDIGENPPFIRQSPTGQIVYKNVNFYDYVKPMIALQDCIGDGGYEWSSANSFISGATGCPGRLPGVAANLMELPDGMRTLHMVRYNQAAMFNPNATQFNPDVFQDGTASPFAVNETQFIYEDFLAIANALKNLEAVPDYLSLDCEQGGHFSNWGIGGTITAIQVQNIYDSPLFQQSWFDMSSPDYMFNYNGRFSQDINLVKNGPYHPQNSNAYLYWNQTVIAMHAQMLNQSIVKVAEEVWGLKNVSNYLGWHNREWDPVYDPEGHAIFSSSIVGNAQSMELYTGFNLNGIYKILDSDPTRIVRTDAVGAGSGTTINSSIVDSWFQMLILIHKIRGAHRGAPNVPIRPWIAPKQFVQGPYNPKWTVNAYGPGLYNESIRHFCLTGVEMFHYWNTQDNSTSTLQQSLTNLNNILSDVNTRLGGWTLQVLVSNRVNFNANYIMSGAVTADGMYLWRVTPKPGVTLIDENANALVVDADGGAWITNSTPEVPVFTV